MSSSYQQRAVRFLRLVDLGDWRIKLYGISVVGSEVPDCLTTAALRVAATILPPPAESEGRPGIGFVTAHAAPSRSYVLISWWAEHNELHQQILSAPPGAADELVLHPTLAIGCVWELGVTDFERRAWITDVLAGSGRSDRSAYLGREYNDIF